MGFDSDSYYSIDQYGNVVKSGVKADFAKFIPATAKVKTQMSASVASSAIYLTAAPECVRDTINKHAFSGGRTTVEELPLALSGEALAVVGWLMHERSALQAQTQALHAEILGLRHPKSGDLMQWKAPIPADMQELLRCLEEASE